MIMEQTRQDNFNALYEIARSINSLLEPEELLERVLEIAMKHLSAERGFIILADPNKEDGYDVVTMKIFLRNEQAMNMPLPLQW